MPDKRENIAADVLEQIEQEVIQKLSFPDHPLSKYDDYQTASVRAQLLLDFMQVGDVDELLAYLNKHGIPDQGWAVPTGLTDGSFYFPVERFLAASATLIWLDMFLEACLNGSYQELNNWLHSEREETNVSVEFWPTAQDKEDILVHWNGVQILTNENIEDVPHLLIPSLQWDKDPKQQIMDSAKFYLQVHLNKLVEKIRPTLAAWSNNSVFEASMGLTTPYQAICYALFEKATGSLVMGKCNNPYCPKPFYVVHGTKKPRKDRLYCSRPGCQKYGYNHPELVPGSVRRKKNKK